MAATRTATLRPLGKVTITVMVDNVSDGLSDPCAACCGGDGSVGSYFREFPRSVKRHNRLDWNNICEAGHGLSLLITGEADGKQHTILFDAGPNADLWHRNATRLEEDLSSVDALMLSHWHSDHSAGFRSAVDDIVAARKGREVIADLHEDRPFARALVTPSGFAEIDENAQWSDFEKEGVVVHREKEGHTILDDFFYISGGIPRVTEFEKGLPGHARKTTEDSDWEMDPLLSDERYLALDVAGRGLVVFSACSHAGIVNVVKDAVDVFKRPILAVVGGFHLAGGSMQRIIPSTIAALQELVPAPGVLLPGHCTGFKAHAALMFAFEDRCQMTAVGGRFQFEAQPVLERPPSKRQRQTNEEGASATAQEHQR